NFINPVTSMFVVARMNNHVDLDNRNINSDYFHGEYQWNNFYLLPKYNLYGLRKKYLKLYNELYQIINNNIFINEIIDKLLVNEKNINMIKFYDQIEINRNLTDNFFMDLWEFISLLEID